MNPLQKEKKILWIILTTIFFKYDNILKATEATL